MSVSVIASTNRQDCINNIMENFLRQDYEDKELIIILNHNYPLDKNILDQIESTSNIYIYRMGSSYSLGECLNYGIDKAKYEFIAKFDDDDYYGERYLTSSIYNLKKFNSDIVGKTSIYIFFAIENILAYRNMNRDFKQVNRVKGSTLVFRKKLFEKNRFKDINLGEDKEFCKDAIKNGFKIISTDKEQYVYVRKKSHEHTWKISNNYLLGTSTKIGTKIHLERLFDNWK